eukprot:TRINITY_DN21242_c0_g1_i1.p1 TRINITY_DN21242_c0_g1~~TRINITY_DN21242_c0_g1_i1.p1  ORF type:complete len:194 (+),score=25.09 TRINITY_DN21242_c0_g1_i1:90-671(+)
MDMVPTPAPSDSQLNNAKAKRKRNASKASQNTLEQRRVRHKQTEQSRRSRITNAVQGMRKLLGCHAKEEQARVLELALERLQALSAMTPTIIDNAPHVPLPRESNTAYSSAATIPSQPSNPAICTPSAMLLARNADEISSRVASPKTARSAIVNPLDVLATTAIRGQTSHDASSLSTLEDGSDTSRSASPSDA